MKIVGLREFRDHATSLLRSTEPILVMRGSEPAGFFLPWDESLFSDELKSALFSRLTKVIGETRQNQGVTEEEVLEDFAAHRRVRR